MRLATPPARHRGPVRRSTPDSPGTASPAAAFIPLPRIEREQLPHQHRHRPAVHQQVMVGQHQPVLLAQTAAPAQTESAAGSPRRSARRGLPPRCRPAAARGRLRPATTGRCCARAPGAPGTITCTGRLSPACRNAARKPAWRSISACAAALSAVLIEPALQREHQLHRIDVRRPRIIERMEQQPLLQRRQRQDVLELRVLRSPGPRSRPAIAPPAAGRSACGRRHCGCSAWRTSASSARNQRCARSWTSSSVSSAGA